MLDKAIRLAELSDCKMRHGAVVIKGGRVLGVGINVMKNDPNIVPDPKTQSSVHAECAAIRACGNTDLRGATLYVARIGKDGKPAMSKPCINCQKALRDRGIKKVFYTVDRSIDL